MMHVLYINPGLDVVLEVLRRLVDSLKAVMCEFQVKNGCMIEKPPHLLRFLCYLPISCVALQCGCVRTVQLGSCPT